MTPPDIRSADHLAAVLDNIAAGYALLHVLFDDSGRPVDWRYAAANARFEAHTGYANPVGRLKTEVFLGLEDLWLERFAEVALTGSVARFEQHSDALGRTYEVTAFPVPSQEARLVGLLFNDVTGERQREANRAFLSDVASVFDTDISLDEIMATVGAKLGHFLGMNSCLFARVDEQADTITADYGWTREGEPSLVRTYRTSEYLNEVFLADSRARRTVAVDDTAVDPRTDARAYAGVNIRAFVTVPYHIEGVWTHMFSVTDAHPRQWAAAELQLLETFARLVFSKLERARADAALRESESRFRVMADAVPQIIWITDSQGRTEFFNRQWAHYTGTPYVPETAADVAAEAVHPDDVAVTMQRFRTALETGSTFEVEHRIRAASGTYRWFLVRAQPEREPATGLPRRWYGTSVDIHDRRVAEQALAETDRRKDEFLATLAHELRNPLAPIRTGLTLLDMDPPPAAATRTREVMARQLSHMVRLIDDLLDISRINTNKIELQRAPLDLRTVLDEAIEAHRPGVDRAGHRLFVSLPPRPLHVDADRTRLVQVVGNLLSNAAKYTPHGGRIDVAAESADGHAIITVRDTGIGIEPSALDDIFDMFTQVSGQTHRSEGGLGIGLALVKRLVELHGGSVGAESGGHGSGATFHVRLPLCTGDASSTGAAGTTIRARASRSLDVLVLDDNVDAAEMMAAVLTAAGHRVQVAHSGPDALGLAASGHPDVAFLDIGLPGMDGYEVARRLRAAPSDRPITLVALTGWGGESDRQRAFSSGFDHHLTKPVDAPRITAVLDALAGP